MPFKIVQSGNGYVVINAKTKHKFSNHPMTKEKAEKQLSILQYRYRVEKQ